MADKKQWFEKEEFWLEFAPIMFDEKRWGEAPAVAENVARLVNLQNGANVMDAGCGFGRISVELALLGYNVTGVDLIKPYLELAKESADDENVALNLVQADLRGYISPTPMDAIFNLYTSFGYCDTKEEDILILQNLYKSLKKGGCLVIESLGREIAVRDFTEGEWFLRAGKIVLTHFEVMGAWEGLKSDWTLIDQKTGKKLEHSFVQRLYPATELCAILQNCGFSSINIYGDFDKSPYDNKARTMVIVATK